MEIRTLENNTQEEILNCFNSAFSDYSVPLQLTLDQMKNKLAIEGIDLGCSAGAFKDNNLIGFIMHGVKEVDNKKLVYNAGTGVIPEARSNGLTVKMYDYILPKIKSMGYQVVTLEVISDNIPAIKSYEKIGFKELRKLNCYRGDLKINGINPEIKVGIIDAKELGKLITSREIEPSWQNSNTAINNLGKEVIFLGAITADNQLHGYVAWNTKKNRIMQLAVAKPMQRKKIASTILNHIKEHYSLSTMIINVDSSSISLNKFLEESGLTIFIEQKEMVLNL